MVDNGGEVELVCIGDTAHIRDLGLKMTRGGKVTTTLSAVAHSRDLEIAKTQGLVSVKTMRAQTIKAGSFPTPSSSNQQTITRSAAHPAAHSPPPVIVPPTPLGADHTVLRALQKLTSEVQSLREEVHRLSASQAQAPDLSALTSAIADVVRTSLSGLSLRSETSGLTSRVESTVVVEEERFIPRGIVSGATANQDIEVTRATTGGVDDAEATLRAARRERERKKEEAKDG